MCVYWIVCVIDECVYVCNFAIKYLKMNLFNKFENKNIVLRTIKNTNVWMYYAYVDLSD